MEIDEKIKPATNRKPAELEQVGGKGSRQRVWEAIRRQTGPFTIIQIAKKAKCNEETVITYVNSLGNAGYLSGESMDGKPVRHRRLWTMEKDNGIEAPRVTRDGKPVTVGRGVESMWRSMRIIGEFNAPELAAHASASGFAVSLNTVKEYAGILKRAGYLIVVREPDRRAGPNGLSRYRLGAGKYTGPRPPMVQRTKSIYDPNLGKVVWQEEPVNDDDL
ncbi:MAG: hypothetical protein M3Y65_18975 [Pseudomonadota bacterium]|nr:hypothetical protein [Pseudomonadota bacterium]